MLLYEQKQTLQGSALKELLPVCLEGGGPAGLVRVWGLGFRVLFYIVIVVLTGFRNYRV